MNNRQKNTNQLRDKTERGKQKSPPPTCLERSEKERLILPKFNKQTFSSKTLLLPRRSTFILLSLKVSASHSFFTTSLQLAIFCISSMTSTTQSHPLFSFRLRTAAQQFDIHAEFVAGTLSAEKN